MKNIKDIKKELEKDIKKLDTLELKKKYLSNNGVLREAFSKISDIEIDKRAEYGEELNQIKKMVEEEVEKENIKEEISNSSRIDPSAPYDINIPKDKRPRILDLKGSKHVLMKEINTFLEIFKSMGFEVVECRQIDDDYHMFESLNFPKGHPARDMYDSFWTKDGLILPAHTSTMQNRILKSKQPPIKTVIPGRVYRSESTDAGHEHTFYQCEGIYVDKNVSVSNMIATIKEFLEAYLEADLEVKIQPAYFPFTEPDCEFTISCPFCNKEGCSTCGYTGWIELMGCGMIHPNVLKSGSIDPQEYSGFAWGFGVDRLTIIKNSIPDIRELRNGSIKFLREY